jgi:hypothetical protein
MPPVLKLLSIVALLCPWTLASECIGACEKEEDETSLVQIKKTVVVGSNRLTQPTQQVLSRGILGTGVIPALQQPIPQAPLQGAQPVVQQPFAQTPLAKGWRPQAQLPVVLPSSPQALPQGAMLFGSKANAMNEAVHDVAKNKAKETTGMQQFQVLKDAQEKMWYKALGAKKMADATDAMHAFQAKMAEEQKALAKWVPDNSASTGGSRTMMPAGDGKAADVILVPPRKQEEQQKPSTEDTLSSVSGSAEMLGPQSANLAPMMPGPQSANLAPMMAGQPPPMAPDFAAVPPGMPQMMAEAPPGATSDVPAAGAPPPPQAVAAAAPQ